MVTVMIWKTLAGLFFFGILVFFGIKSQFLNNKLKSGKALLNVGYARGTGLFPFAETAKDFEGYLNSDDSGTWPSGISMTFSNLDKCQRNKMPITGQTLLLGMTNIQTYLCNSGFAVETTPLGSKTCSLKYVECWSDGTSKGKCTIGYEFEECSPRR